MIYPSMRLTSLKGLLALLAVGASVLAQGKTLVYCSDADPDGFDSAQSDVAATHRAAAYPLYNRLLSIDPADGKPVPELASNWLISADGKTYTFNLRRDVKFHKTAWFSPSRDLNADDVLWSLGRQLDARHPGAAAGSFPGAISGDWAKLIHGIDKQDAYTVRITLNQPYAPLLTLLAGWQASIVSAEYGEALTKRGEARRIATEPVGTGPYQLVKYEHGSKILYAANPAYFLGKPGFDKLVFSISADASVRVQKLRSGECGLVDSLKPQDIAGLSASQSVKILSYQPQITSFLAFNTERKPFADPRVRRALSMAIDRAAIVKTVFEGRATVGTTPYSAQALWGAPTLPAPRVDVPAAKRLLAEAGLADGFDTSIWVRVGGGSSNLNPRLTAELIQADWAKIGVRARLVVMEAAELGRRTRLGEHDSVISGWQNSLDPDEIYANLLTCDAAKSSTARWCDAAFDKLIDAGRAASDSKQRSKHYEAAAQRFMEAAPWAVLAYPQASLGYKAGLQGIQPSAAAPFNFARLY